MDPRKELQSANRYTNTSDASPTESAPKIHVIPSRKKNVIVTLAHLMKSSLLTPLADALTRLRRADRTMNTHHKEKNHAVDCNDQENRGDECPTSAAIGREPPVAKPLSDGQVADDKVCVWWGD